MRNFPLIVARTNKNSSINCARIAMWSIVKQTLAREAGRRSWLRKWLSILSRLYLAAQITHLLTSTLNPSLSLSLQKNSQSSSSKCSGGNNSNKMHRYSWGSGHSHSSSTSLHSSATLGLGSSGKDDLWAAIQTNYNYIMDTNLLDTCKEARFEIEEAQPTSRESKFTGSQLHVSTEQTPASVE